MFVLTMAAYNLTRMRTLGKIRPQRREGAGNAGNWGSKGRKRAQRERKFDDASELNEKSNF